VQQAAGHAFGFLQQGLQGKLQLGGRTLSALETAADVPALGDQP
jgi:hypothetical protein